jgi:hypothetical protein
VKLHNGYREPLPLASKMAHKVKQGNLRTFDDNNEDDEDD